MRSICLLLSLFLLMELTPICPLSASAATTTANPSTASGAIEAKVTLNKVGALLLADGLAALSNSEIEVSARDHHSSGTPRTQLLSGILVKVEKFGTDNGAMQTGLAYFNGGPGLPSLIESNCPEKVLLNNGDQFAGRILKLTQDVLDFQDSSNVAHRFGLAELKEIHSPKVFKYSVSASGQSQSKISFNSTCTKSGTPTKTSTKVIAFVIAAVIIATAIAVPVAVSIATHHPHHNTPFFPFKPPAPAPVIQPVKQPPRFIESGGG